MAIQTTVDVINSPFYIAYCSLSASLLHLPISLPNSVVIVISLSCHSNHMTSIILIKSSNRALFSSIFRGWEECCPITFQAFHGLVFQFINTLSCTHSVCSSGSAALHHLKTLYLLHNAAFSSPNAQNAPMNVLPSFLQLLLQKPPFELSFSFLITKQLSCSIATKFKSNHCHTSNKNRI